jgi:hypothetical protein
LGVVFRYHGSGVFKSLIAAVEVAPWWKTGQIDIEVKEELVMDCNFDVDANKVIQVSDNKYISQIFQVLAKLPSVHKPPK